MAASEWGDMESRDMDCIGRMAMRNQRANHWLERLVGTAEDLEEYEKWRPLLHDLGTCEAKHGVRVSVVNLSRSARTFALLIAQEHLQIFLRNFAYGVATPVAVFKVSVFNLDAMRLALCRASFFVQ
jgi:hypothetical protein